MGIENIQQLKWLNSLSSEHGLLGFFNLLDKCSQVDYEFLFNTTLYASAFLMVLEAYYLYAIKMQGS